MDQWMFISHNQIHTLFPDTFFFHSYFQIYVVWLMDILIFYILLYYHSWAISTFRFLNVFFPPAAHYNNIHYPDCHSPPPLPYLVLNSNIKYFNEFNFDTALIWKKKYIYIVFIWLHKKNKIVCWGSNWEWLKMVSTSSVMSKIIGGGGWRFPLYRSL